MAHPSSSPLAKGRHRGVANMLNRVVDRAVQVHWALGYSLDTPSTWSIASSKRICRKSRWSETSEKYFPATAGSGSTSRYLFGRLP
jgi:hypothetical protein